MRDGDWLIGMGLRHGAVSDQCRGGDGPRAAVADGTVRVQTAAHDLGTGAYTVIGQMAAERLGVDLAAVTVELGDTSLPPAPVAGGSNTTASVCSTVLIACDAIRDKLFKSAGQPNQGPVKAVLEKTGLPARSRNTRNGFRRALRPTRSRSSTRAPAR